MGCVTVSRLAEAVGGPWSPRRTTGRQYPLTVGQFNCCSHSSDPFLLFIVRTAVGIKSAAAPSRVNGDHTCHRVSHPGKLRFRRTWCPPFSSASVQHANQVSQRLATFLPQSCREMSRTDRPTLEESRHSVFGRCATTGHGVDVKRRAEGWRPAALAGLRWSRPASQDGVVAAQPAREDRRPSSVLP